MREIKTIPLGATSGRPFCFAFCIFFFVLAIRKIKCPVCEHSAFLRILFCFLFVLLLLFLSVLNLTSCEQVGYLGQLRSLRSVSCFIINSTLGTPNSKLSIVGSAHTRSLFVKSETKTFVFFCLSFSSLLHTKEKRQSFDCLYP